MDESGPSRVEPQEDELEQPRRHWSEGMRREVIELYGVMDTEPETDFDDLVSLAAQACETPMALLNIVAPDRTFFKAEHGLGVRTMPIELSFCTHAIEQCAREPVDIIEIPDAAQDARFQDNELVTGEAGIRFYASVILRAPDGMPLGTMGVVDTQPKTLNAEQRNALLVLARQANRLLDLRRAMKEADRANSLRQRIVDSALDYAIIATDPDGNIVSWSPGAERILGWREDEAVGEHFSLFFTERDLASDRPAREMAEAHDTEGAVEERWHRRKDESEFWADGRLMPLRNDHSEVVGYVKIMRDRTQRHHLVEEVMHRTRNTLGIVTAIVTQTISHSRDLKAAQDLVGARLGAYARAQTLLLDNDWTSAKIGAVISDALAPYEAHRDRIALSGPELTLTPHRTLGLSLAMHELMANAVKHGALSGDQGRVAVEWSLDESDTFAVAWRESGGPSVTQPDHRGFGTTVLSTVVPSYFDGKASLTYETDGLLYALSGSLGEVSVD